MTHTKPFDLFRYMDSEISFGRLEHLSLPRPRYRSLVFELTIADELREYAHEARRI